MSRLSIPIRYKTLFATGDVKLWIDIDLFLKDRSGNWCSENFLVDTATEITTFSAYEAKRIGLPIPVQASPGAIHTQTGLAIRSGYLRFRVAGMDQTEYVSPCLFLGDPDTPPDLNRPVLWPRSLLQPLALLDQLWFTMRKLPNDGTLYGTLTIEKA